MIEKQSKKFTWHFGLSLIDDGQVLQDAEATADAHMRKLIRIHRYRMCSFR